MSKKITQTAGRAQLGAFAPTFAHLNDDVLFGEVWNEEAIDIKTKCIITVVSLMASGITDSSLGYHLQNAKNNGVTKAEIAAIITHATMYVGWPKGWAVFRQAKEIWNEEEPAQSEKDALPEHDLFPHRGREPLRAVLRGAELSGPPIHAAGAGLQRDLRAGLPQQLAHPSRLRRRRADAHLRGRPWLVSGMGQGARRDDPGHGGQHSRQRQALARRGLR